MEHNKHNDNGGYRGRGGDGRRSGGFGRGGSDRRSGGRRGHDGDRRDGGRKFDRDGKRFERGDRKGGFDRRDSHDGGRRFDRDDRGGKRFERNGRPGGKRYDRDGDRGGKRFDRDGERRGFDRGDRKGSFDRRGPRDGAKRFEGRDGGKRFDRDARGFGAKRSDSPYRREGQPDFKKRAPLQDDLDFAYDKEIDEWVNDGSLMEFFASCAGGMEFSLANELKEQIGIKRTRPLRGGVAFYGELRDAYKACLWSRLASRVFYVVGRCDAKNETELYEGVKAMAWSRQIPVGKTISVFGHGTNDELRNTQFTALRAKDGLCDALRAGRGKRPDVDLSRPDVLIDVNIRGDRATISIDLVGTSLHHRSYERPGVGGDGTKSALAAAALESSWWQRAASEGKPFIDPLCRDGYLVTEAAMVAADMAPNLARSRWGFMGWNGHDEDVWNELLEEAEDRLDAALENMPPLYALALDDRVQENVVAMLKRAGLAQYVTVVDGQDEKAVARVMKMLDATLGGLEAAELARLEQEAADEAQRSSDTADTAETTDDSVVEQDVPEDALADEPSDEDAADLEHAGDSDVPSANDEAVESSDEQAEAAPADASDARKGDEPAPEHRVSVRGIAATVLPFGQDSADALGLETYRRLLDVLMALPRSWKYVIVSDDDAIERYIASRTVVRPESIRLGKVKAYVRRYVRIEAAERCEVTVFDVLANRERVVPVLEQTSEQFAARLKKSAKERRKWAEKNHITCYRVYDADLPDYAVAIDVYHGAEESRGQTYLVIAEYQAPRGVDMQRAERRMRDILTLAPIVFGVDADKVFNRVRKHEKGGGQYRSVATRSRKATVEENGCMFEVDFGSYLDTGLFLDHRTTRAKVAELAVGRSFLNLFAYTGTASVHAAVAGAKSTLTIDLSQTYLDWAERNMLKNGIEGRAHRYLRTDVMTWIRNEVRVGRTYGVIFVDPPTFSNSKSMGKDTWSVQRDHVEMLSGVSRLLEDDGIAVFSCNLRTFRPDVAEIRGLGLVMCDVTAATIPHDFERTPRIHKCYLLAKEGHEDALARACAVFGADMVVMEPEAEEAEEKERFEEAQAFEAEVDFLGTAEAALEEDSAADADDGAVAEEAEHPAMEALQDDAEAAADVEAVEGAADDEESALQ